MVADEAKLAIVFTYFFFLLLFFFFLLRLLFFTPFGEMPVAENLFPPIFYTYSTSLMNVTYHLCVSICHGGYCILCWILLFVYLVSICQIVPSWHLHSSNVSYEGCHEPLTLCT